MSVADCELIGNTFILSDLVNIETAFSPTLLEHFLTHPDLLLDFQSLITSFHHFLISVRKRASSLKRPRNFSFISTRSYHFDQSEFGNLSSTSIDINSDYSIVTLNISLTSLNSDNSCDTIYAHYHHHNTAIIPISYGSFYFSENPLLQHFINI